MSISDSVAHAASGSSGKNTMQGYLQEYYGKILTKSDDLETNAASSCGARANMPELASDPVLFREGLGALYWNDFLELARARGFRDPRLVKDSRITISNKKIRARVGDIAFFSATYRLFKLPELERDCEDYGEAVIYKGTLSSCPEAFALDRHHTMDAGRVCPVSRNTLHMLTRTRFARHFDKVGDGATHLGLFPGRGKQIPFASAAGKGAAAAAKAGCC